METKNFVIAVEPISKQQVEPGYLKFYLDGNKWTWRSVNKSSLASRLNEKTADWKSKKIQAGYPAGVVIFYPIEI